MRGRHSPESLRCVAAMWLLLAVTYIPWMVGIVSMARHGAQFSVGLWTLATPFVIVLVAPISALLVFRKRTVSGGVLLAVVATDRILYEGVSQRFLSLREGYPFSLLQLLLGAVTVAVVTRELVRHREVAR